MDFRKYTPQERKEPTMSQQPTTTETKPPVSQQRSIGRAAPAAAATKDGAGGRGLSTRRVDNLVPLVYVLDAKSKQCDKQDPQYIRGAEAGMILLRGAQEPLVDGDKGMMFQPCDFWREWNIWAPKRGGFVSKIPIPDSVDDVNAFIVKQVPGAKEVEVNDEQGNPRKVWRDTKTGNDLVFTRCHAGFVLSEDGSEPPLPYIIPLSSTGHSVSRAWMPMMNRKTLPDGRIADSFACVYRLRTRQRTNTKGKWYVLNVEDVVDEQGALCCWLDDAQVEMGEALRNAIRSGEKTAEAPMERGDDSGSDEARAERAERAGV